jgi:O-antigen ligase
VFVAGAIAFVGVETEKLALYAVGLLVLTLTWNGIRVGGGSGSNTVSGGGAFGDATLVLATGAVLADVLLRRRPMPLPPWLMLAGAGCLLGFLLNMMFPPSAKLTNLTGEVAANLAQQGAGATGTVGTNSLASDAITLIEVEIGLILIPVLIATVGTTVKRCRLLTDLFIVGAAINGAVGLLGLAGFHIFSSAAFQSRSAGLTIHPNYLALTCVLALPMAMLWFGRSRRYNIAAVIAVGSLLGGVYASGSRAGFVAAIIAVVVTTIIVPRLRRGLPILLPLAGVGLVGLLLFTSTGHKLLVQLRLASDASGANPSTAGSNFQRSLLASVAWTQIQARPLVGVGWSQITTAHDIYLELLDSAGIIALASFLVFLGGMVASLRRALSGPLRGEAIVCAVGILAWLANGVFDNQVGDKYLYVVPGLLLAIGRTSWLLQREAAPAVIDREPHVLGIPAPGRTLAGVGTG